MVAGSAVATYSYGNDATISSTHTRRKTTSEGVAVAGMGVESAIADTDGGAYTYVTEGDGEMAASSAR